MTLYAVAGLDQKIELPVPLILAILPPSQTLNRPGFPLRQPPKWIQHETGNPRVGANALMHSRYLDQGAPDQFGRPQQLSYHFTVDDGVIYQKVPINEVSWQAADGGGPGNYQCISSELCINQGIVVLKSRHNAEALAGAILKAKGRTAADVGRHWDYNFALAPAYRHHCPDQMMNEGYWPTFVANVATIITGLPPKPPVVWPKPIIPSWMNDADLAKGIDRTLNGVTMHACRRSWKATKATPRYRTASLSADKLGPDIKRGESFLGEFIFLISSGWWILTRYGTRVYMGDCVPKAVIG